MERYLIDNNVISGYFSNSFPEKSMIFLSEIIDEIPNISVITQIEALSWIHSNKTKENIVKMFIDDAIVLPLTNEIVSRCIKIRRSNKLKTPDAIIAATAIEHNFTLLTKDKDFFNVKGLKIFPW